MTANSNRNRPRGLTIVEVLITGSLFAVILGMVGQAMVLGHRSQRSLSTKLEAVRRASLALDLLVRDAQSARLSTRVTYRNPGLSPVPTTLTTVSGGDEFRVDRFQQAAVGLLGDPVSVGYWLVPGAGVADGTVNRTMYDRANPGNFINGYTANGRILVRDVRDFQVSMVQTAVPTLWSLNAQISVSTVGPPVTAAVTLEAP